MTDTTREAPKIYKVMPADGLRAVENRYGVNPWPLVPERETRDGVDLIRALAAACRTITDPELPQRPELAAAAFEALGDELAARHYIDEDRVAVTDEHRTLIREWNDRCGARSPLLGPLCEELGEMWWKEFAWVGQARRALEMLADANLILPGLDAALRPVLTIYAGLEER
jgi:hypothetical protein